MSIFKQFRKSFAITKKDLAVFYLKGPVVVSGLLTPAFLFLAFMFGRKLPLEFLIPGLLGMALFVTASSIGPIIAPWETRMRTLERLVSAPIALWAIILGDIVASLLFGLLIIFFILLASVILLGLGVLSWALILGTILAAFCFSSLGLLISVPPTDNPSNIMMLSSLIKFPLIFISGVFVPLAEMSGLKIIAFISPLTYYVDIARSAMQGENYFNPAIALLILFGFTILFFVLAIKGHEKSLAKRF